MMFHWQSINISCNKYSVMISQLSHANTNNNKIILVLFVLILRSTPIKIHHEKASYI